MRLRAYFPQSFFRRPCSVSMAFLIAAFAFELSGFGGGGGGGAFLTALGRGFTSLDSSGCSHTVAAFTARPLDFGVP